MALRLTILSTQARSLGERAIKQFGRDGGTIGRSLECDWVLPDTQRYVSGRHASIDFRSGSYYLVDTSTNGVYVNDSECPVGRGKPQRLFSGDRVRIGVYEIGVQIDGDEETTSLMEDRHVDPVDLAQRVGAPEQTGYDLVDSAEITGVGIEALLSDNEAETLIASATPADFELELVEEDQPPPPKTARAPRRSAPAAKDAPAPPPLRASTESQRHASTESQPRAGTESPTRRPPLSATPPAAAKPAGGPAQVHGQSTNLLDPFFRGAGLSARPVDAQEAEAILLRLGRLIREMVLGVSDSLHLRAQQKNALRLDNTTIQQRNNNPLKFSASVEETLANLLFRQSQEHLPAIDAVREAYGDIRLHQHLLLESLRAALDTYARRLDPDALEHTFSRGKSGVLMGAAKKLKYWDLYKDLYQIVAHHSPGELPAQFLDDFARAYEAEAERASKSQSEHEARAG